MRRRTRSGRGCDRARESLVECVDVVPHHDGSRLSYLIGKKTLMPLRETSWHHQGRVYEAYDF